MRSWFTSREGRGVRHCFVFLFVASILAAQSAPSPPDDGAGAPAPLYDVFVVEARGRPLEEPGAAALYVGRVATPAGLGESPRLEAASADGLITASVFVRRDPSGAALLYRVNETGDDDLRSQRLDRGLLVDAEASFRRGRGRDRRRRRASLVAIRAQANDPQPAKDLSAGEAYARLCRALTEEAPRGGALGEVLGRVPLTRLVPAADLATFRAAWRARLLDRRRDATGDSPYYPALLAAADPETLAEIYASDPRGDEPKFDGDDEEDATAESRSASERVVVVEADGRRIVHAGRFRAPPASRWEFALALAYVQADDPKVRGIAGWLSYKYNPGAFFEPLAQDVVAGRAHLPGDDADRLRREANLRQGLKARDIRPALMAVGVGLAAMGVVLFLLRTALSRLLFR
jgi:hypothetical protein